MLATRVIGSQMYPYDHEDVREAPEFIGLKHCLRKANSKVSLALSTISLHLAKAFSTYRVHGSARLRSTSEKAA